MRYSIWYMCISSAVANHEVVFDQHSENEWLAFRVSAREYFINNILGKEAFFPFVTHSPRILWSKYSHLPRWEYKQSDFKRERRISTDTSTNCASQTEAFFLPMIIWPISGGSLEVTSLCWMTWFSLCSVFVFSTAVIGSGGTILSCKKKKYIKSYPGILSKHNSLFNNVNLKKKGIYKLFQDSFQSTKNHLMQR